MAERNETTDRAASNGTGWTWLVLLLLVLAALLALTVPRWLSEQHLSSVAPPPESAPAALPDRPANALANTVGMPAAPLAPALPQGTTALPPGATVAQPPPLSAALRPGATFARPAAPATALAPLAPAATPGSPAPLAPGQAAVLPLAAAPARDDQAELLVRIAADRLRASHDVQGALALLADADAALRDARQPAALALHAAIANDTAALRAYLPWDRDTLGAQLTALDARWDTLPLSFVRAGVAAAPATTTDTVQPSLLRRWMQVARHHFAGLVRVRTDRVPGELPLDDTHHSAFVRQGLHLHTQQAGLAALRRQTVAYRGALAALQRLLEANFSAQDAGVAQARVQLLALARLDPARAPPIITAAGLLPDLAGTAPVAAAPAVAAPGFVAPPPASLLPVAVAPPPAPLLPAAVAPPPASLLPAAAQPKDARP